MEQIMGIFSNYVLRIGFAAWLSAQVLKVLITWLLTRQMDWSRLFGLGGMPSSHAAFVCAISMALGFHEGFHSAIFGLSACVSLVVMTDATGVRRETGNQAKVLNRIIDDMIYEGKGIDERKLKELIGHTPVQVFAGALLGILVGVLVR